MKTIIRAFIALALLLALAALNGCSKDKPAPTAPTGPTLLPPMMKSALITNGKLYVTCQRLKNWGYGDTSLVVVVNPVNDSIETAISLTHFNPADMKDAMGKLFVICSGGFGVQDGGLERIDVASGASDGVLLTEATAGGDLCEIQIVNSRKAYLRVLVGGTANEIFPFYLSGSTLGSRLTYVNNACSDQSMAFDDITLYVGDRGGTTPGLIKVDTATNAQIDTTLTLGLIPAALTYYFTGPGYVVATTTDVQYSEGNVTTCQKNTTGIRSNLLSIGSDVVPTSYNGALYLIDRTNATLTRINGETINTTTAHDIPYAVSLGAASNPQAIAFYSSTKAYVARLNALNLLIINPATGDSIGAVSFAKYALEE